MSHRNVDSSFSRKIKRSSNIRLHILARKHLAGARVPFQWGMSSPFGCKFHWMSFSFIFLTVMHSKPQKGQKKSGKSSLPPCERTCTHTVGRKMQSCAFVLVLWGQEGKPTPACCFPQLLGMLLSAMPRAKAGRGAHKQA